MHQYLPQLTSLVLHVLIIHIRKFSKILGEGFFHITIGKSIPSKMLKIRRLKELHLVYPLLEVVYIMNQIIKDKPVIPISVKAVIVDKLLSN